MRLIGVGAHDALTASLIQRSGFEVAWVGSFEASTYRRMPDINVITSTEMADAVRAARRQDCRIVVLTSPGPNFSVRKKNRNEC